MKSLMILLLVLLPVSCAHKIEYQLLNKTLPQEVIPSGDVRIALVLSGGGAKGYAHVGVLEVLEQNNIPIDLIVGTSIGSLVGALYADDPDIEALKKKMKSFAYKQALNTSFASILYGPITGEYIVDFLCKNLKHHNIEDFQIPFVAVATNLDTNQPFIFRMGPAIPAVHASIAVPGLFTPVYAYGHNLVDGGAVENVPVSTAQKFAPKMIIAVNIASPPPSFDYDKAPFIHGNRLGIAYQAMSIAFYELSKMETLSADIQISPELSKFDFLYTSDKDSRAIYKIGKKSAEKAITSIKTKMYKLGISHKKRATINSSNQKGIYQK